MAAYSAGISLLLSECPNSDQFVNTYSSRPYSSCSIPYGSLSTLAVSFVSGNNNPHYLKSLSSLSRFQRLSFKAVSHRRGFWHVEGCKWLQCCRLFDGINRQISCACDCKRGKSFSQIRSNKGFGQSQIEDFIDSNRCRYTFTGKIQSARINPEGGENFSYINSPENSQRVSDPDGGDSLDHSLDRPGESALQGEVVKSVANLSSISTDLKDSGVDSSVVHLRELLHVSREDFQDARVNSAQLEEKARMVAEKGIALKDQAIDAEGAADSARLRLERLLADESAAEVALQDAKSAFSAAVLQMKLAQESVEQACRRFEEMNISRSADHHSMGAVVEIVERPDHDNAEDKCENISDNVAGALNLNTEKANVEGIYESLAREMVLSEESASISDTRIKEKEVLQAAQAELSAREKDFAKSEAELFQVQKAVQELKEELSQLNEVALRVRAVAVAAEEDVATAMSMAEKAVALELEAAQKLNDAEITVQKAESFTLDTVEVVAVPGRTEKQEMTVTHVVEAFSEDEKANLEMTSHEADGRPRNSTVEMVVVDGKGLFLNEAAKETLKASFSEEVLEVLTKNTDSEKPAIPGLFVETKAKDFSAENRKLNLSIPKEGGDEKIKTAPQLKKVEMLKEVGEPGIIKACMKKSSRFFPASFFSLEDGEEFSPKRVFSGFLANLRHLFPTLFIGLLLVGAGGAYFNNRLEKRASLFESPEITSSIEDVAINTRPLIKKLGRIPSKLRKFINELPLEIHEDEASLFDVLWLLLASVIFVPIFQKLPGGSPVLGYLAAGVLIGPHCLHIIRHVHGTKAIAEFGVVFLLFNIGLELSVERLSSMKKYVFGFGSSQVFSTAIVAGLFVHYVSGITVPAAIILGNGLALSSTAVVLQVLQERGESTSRHGRAAFSVLLFQDLAVVVLLILIPLISPNSSKGGVGVQAIAEALGIAAVKAVIAITGIIGGCRLLLRPIYKRMAENHNAEIFAANTLLVVLGTSVLTARAGLSMALGAFLAGLLLAETEFALQVESDIAPYRGLLLGLFFMTVGMSIDPRLFLAKFPVILGGLALLIGGKTLLITALGRQFGLSTVAALRSGLLLAPGGEFAFVAFGEAVNHGILSSQMSSLLFLVVGLSMALTPWLAAGGQLIASRLEHHDVRNLLPAENETDDLQGHMIICGFGRVGQIIAQLLSESLIPFVALDMRSERVSAGRALDLPVYFGDAGSKEVLHKLGAERAAAAVITLDTPGASYRAVWALSKHFPHVKTFVRAHDIDHGLILEKAGATAVVPETLEPSLQLASALLAQAKLPASEIATTIDEFRSRHLSELTELSETSGTSLGYGFSRIMTKPRPPVFDVPSKKVDDDGSSDKRVGGLVVAVP